MRTSEHGVAGATLYEYSVLAKRAASPHSDKAAVRKPVKQEAPRQKAVKQEAAARRAATPKALIAAHAMCALALLISLLSLLSHDLALGMAARGLTPEALPRGLRYSGGRCGLVVGFRA